MTLTPLFKIIEAEPADCAYFKKRNLIAYCNHNGSKIWIRSSVTGEVIDTIKTVSSRSHKHFNLHEDYLIVNDKGERLLYDMDTKEITSLGQDCYPNPLYLDDYLSFDYYDMENGNSELCFFDTKSKKISKYCYNSGSTLPPQTGGKYYLKVFNKKENRYPEFVKILISNDGEVSATETEVRCPKSIEDTLSCHFALGQEDYIYFEGVEDGKISLSLLNYQNELLKTIEIVESNVPDPETLYIGHTKLFYREVEGRKLLLLKLSDGKLDYYRFIDITSGELVWSYESSWGNEPHSSSHLAIVVAANEKREIEGYYLLSFRTAEVEYFPQGQPDLDLVQVAALNKETIILVDMESGAYVGYDVEYD